MEKNCIKRIIFFIKSKIDNKFNIKKIDINTDSEYYNINAIIIKENVGQRFFMEIILNKYDYSILHCFTNYISDKDDDIIFDIIGKEEYKLDNILKIFYDNKKSSFICNNSKYNDIIKKSNIYEIINKDYYYTYNVDDNYKLKFISKGIQNCIQQNINNEILNIIINNNKYILYLKTFKSSKNCKYNIRCVNPECKLNHPNDYNINKAYIDYILIRKKQSSNFKTIRCNNDDNNCIKHKYNKCAFLHTSDPIPIS